MTDAAPLAQARAQLNDVAAEQTARLAQHRQAEEWLADANTWVGVFENKDRQSPNFGARIGYPFSYDDVSTLDVAVGKTRAPDTKTVPHAGQFVLTAICRTPEEVVDAMFYQDPANEDKPRFN